MTQEDKKRRAAEAAMDQIGDAQVIGVGTGSTINFFIEQLANIKQRLDGAVASSAATEKLLRKYGIPVLDLNSVNDLALYVDGADEADRHLRLVKGGGGALTREKIVAAASRRFICIVDDSKLVDVLGKFPLPVEVIPMARSYVGRELAKLGGQPALRSGFTTDNGNVILDVHNLSLLDAGAMEERINNITGVVCNGLFARRHADLLLVGHDEDVKALS